MIFPVDYRELQEDCIFIDVRSPEEYKQATIEGAVNIPLFSDEERKEIGTVYTQESIEKAKRMGIQVVSKKLPQIYDEAMELWKQGKKLVFFCARGGMRSGSIVMLFNSLGINVIKLKGGYKGYRKVVTEELIKLNEEVQYIVLHGNTGVGKTEILKMLEQDGHDVLDLEEAANHRGSLLGNVGLGNQVTQKAFESTLYHKLKSFKSKYVLVEAESRRIGKVFVPDFIHNKMKEGKHIFVDADIEFRANIIVDEYTKEENSNEEINKSLDKLSKYISNSKIDEYKNMVLEGKYTEVAKELMIKYYDPMYMNTSDKYEYDLKIKVENIKNAAKEIENWMKNS